MATIHKVKSVADHLGRIPLAEATAAGLVMLRLWGSTVATFKGGALYVARPGGAFLYRMRTPNELAEAPLAFSPYHQATAASLYAEAYRCLAIEQTRQAREGVAEAEPSHRHPWYSPKRIAFIWNRIQNDSRKNAA